MFRRLSRVSLLYASLALALALTGCKHKGPSDEDLLDRFVSDVTGPANDLLVERSIGYTQLQELPIDVRVPHFAGVYDASRATELLQGYRDGMRTHFYGTELELRSKKIELHGEPADHADVTLALMTAVGPLHASIGLQKLGTGWKVASVHVDR